MTKRFGVGRGRAILFAARVGRGRSRRRAPVMIDDALFGKSSGMGGGAGAGRVGAASSAGWPAGRTEGNHRFLCGGCASTVLQSRSEGTPARPLPSIPSTRQIHIPPWPWFSGPSVRSPHFPLQKLAAVHPEGRCDWLSCQVGRSGPKSYPTQPVRKSCWPVA